MRFSLVIFLFAASCIAEEARTWTDRAGRTFSAQILACDALRATLDVAGRGKVIVPLASLSVADAEIARQWRTAVAGRALIDPACMAPWPAQAAGEAVMVQLVQENAAAHAFAWESAHFRITADSKLSLSVVRDFASVFEATREVLLTIPLGLYAGGERAKYPVRLFSVPEDYAAAGGVTATGGHFNGREMLILLPNLGIKPGSTGTTAEYAKNIFVLKHEVTHQMLRPWGGVIPVWLNEGFAECVASWPYTQGRYSLQNLDTPLHDYLLKWRKTTDKAPLRIIGPQTLMNLSNDGWREQVASQSAYDHYNSAALLAHYFLRHDGRGDSAGIAGYFDSIRRGITPSEAAATHLLRGRDYAAVTADLQKLARRLALDIKIE